MSKQSADLIWVSYLESAAGKFPNAEAGFDKRLKSVVRRAMEGRFTNEMLWEHIDELAVASNEPAFGIIAGLATSTGQKGALIRLAVIAAPSPKDLYWLYRSTICRQYQSTIRCQASLHGNRVRLLMSFDSESQRPAVEAATAGLVRRLGYKSRTHGNTILYVDPSRFDVWEKFDKYPKVNFVKGSSGGYAIDYIYPEAGVSGNEDWPVLKAEIERVLPPEINQDAVSTQVVDYLMTRPQPASVTLEKVAEILDTSVSTLRRKVRTEGLKYKDIQLRVIWDRARALLMDTDQPIETISETLGFTDRTSFTQSFKRAAGMTPQDFRASHKRIQSSLYKSLVDYFESIPPQPDIVRKLMKVRQDQNADVSVVTSVIGSDPLKRAKVIAAASTATYGVKVNSLSDAVGRVLGIDRAINAALFHSFQESLGTDQLMVKPDKVSLVADISCPLFTHLTNVYKWPDLMNPRAVSLALSFTPLGIYVTANELIASSMLDIEAPLECDALALNTALQQQVQMNGLSIAGLVLASWGVLESEFALSSGSKEYFSDPSRVDHPMASILLTSMLAETAVIRPNFLDGLIGQIDEWGLMIDKDVKAVINELIRSKRV